MSLNSIYYKKVVAVWAILLLLNHHGEPCNTFLHSLLAPPQGLLSEDIEITLVPTDQRQIEELKQLAAQSKIRYDKRITDTLRRWIGVAAVKSTGKVVGGFFSSQIYGSSDVVWIAGGVVVDSEYRKLGIGKSLVRKREELFANAGYKKITFSIYEESVGFWEKMGYTIKVIQTGNTLLFSAQKRLFDSSTKRGKRESPLELSL